MNTCTFEAPDPADPVTGYLVAGQWGVHRAPQKPSLWVVRHLGTGMSVSDGRYVEGWNTRKEAAALAKYLDQVLPETRKTRCLTFFKRNRIRVRNAISLGRTLARCAAR